MNVNLWFARDKNNKIISILNSSNDNTYTCPICASTVIPKALESVRVTPHFAHIDKEKCSSESMLHWWFKHEFIERGDTFTIISDEKHTYTCEDFKTEVTFKLESGIYRPDIVIKTTCGNEIVFEMANTNKKKVQDYIDRWIELDKIVVEVNIPSLTNDIKEFKALYFKGKCFNFNKRDGGYYNTIGKLKEELRVNGKYDIELVKKLDWFWNEIDNYNKGEVNIDHMGVIIDEIRNISSNTESVVLKILKTSKCTNLYADYKDYLQLDDYVRFEYKGTDKYLEDCITKINSLLINLDTRLELKTMYKKQKIYESYYNGSRKYRYKYREVDHYYHVDLVLRYNKRSVCKIQISNRFMEKGDKYTYILNECIKSIPSNRKCRDCNSKYEVVIDEIKFYLSKELTLPKRCKACRNNRKNMIN